MIIDVERFLASHPYSRETCATYGRILRALVADLADLEHLDAAGLLTWIRSRPTWGNSQQYVALCACRSFLSWRFGHDHAAILARIKRMRARRQRVLTADRALQLLACFDPRTPKGARDLAIAALGLDTGLRASELCRLRMADVDLSTRTLQVITKGGQWGVGVFSAETAQYLDEWLSVRHCEPGVETIFVSVWHGRPLTRAGLGCIVRGWGRLIGVKL